MLDMSVLDEVEKYVNHVLNARHKMIHPELVDDALQEGMIQAWRDIDAGMEPKIKVLRRAAMAAEKFVHRQGEYFFGRHPKSRAGISREGEPALEKVQGWMEETKGLRETYWPKEKDVAQATGLSVETVRRALHKIRRGDIDHMKYFVLDNGERRADFEYYHTHSVETLVSRSNQESGAQNTHWTDSVEVSQFNESFEDESVESQDFMNRLKSMSPNDAKALYLYYVEGHTTAEVGRRFGRDYPNLSGKGAKLVASARKRYAALLEAEAE